MQISVLINNFNNGRWLRQCVDSVLAQTRPPDEVIVYDDGSTDNSLEILRSYGARVHLIEGVHRNDRSNIASQAAAIEAAFAASSGERIYLLDGDDFYLAHHLAVCEEAWAKRPDAVMVQSPMKMVDERGADRGVSNASHFHQTDYRRAIYRTGMVDFFFPTSTLSFRRSFFRNQFPMHVSGLSRAADQRLWYAAVFAGPILCIAEPSVVYRVHPSSIMARNGLRALSPLVSSELNMEFFNEIAAAHGQPPANPWKNTDFVLRRLRRASPRWLGGSAARLKLFLTKAFSV